MATLLQRNLPQSAMHVNDFRLTGDPDAPVMTSDSTTLSTLYLAPYTGNYISLLDNNNNIVYVKSSGVSLAVTGRTANIPFDVFVYDSAGSLALEYVNWGSANARSTSLVRVDGIWTKSGAATRRYLGTCRPRSATTFHHVMVGIDSPGKLDLWNSDNRVNYVMMQTTTTASWGYASAIVRQAANNANNQCDFIAGLREDFVTARIVCTATIPSTSTAAYATIGIGHNIPNTLSGVVSKVTSAVSGQFLNLYAEYAALPAVGRNYMAWCEYTQTTASVTFYGPQSGLSLSLRG